MKIRIETALTEVAKSVATRLIEGGHDVDVLCAATSDFEFAYVRELPLEDVSALLGSLKPFAPAITPVRELVDADAVLRIGAAEPLSKWDLTLHADDAGFGSSLNDRLQIIGYTTNDVVVEEIEEERMRYGGATPLARQILRWMLAELGLPNVEEERSWSDSDQDIWLYLRDPALLGKPLQERCAVVLASDDLSAGLLLQTRLKRAGFTRVELRPLDESTRPTFTLKPGLLESDGELMGTAHAIISAFLADQGADPTRYPLIVDKNADDSDATAVLTLPLSKHRAETLRPWAGTDSDRWDVRVLTDAPSTGMRLTAAMQRVGLENVRVQHDNSSLIDTVVRYPPAASATAEQVRDLLLAEDLGLLEVRLDPSLPSDGHSVYVELPLSASTTREERMRTAAAGWEMTLKCEDLSLISELEHDLRTLPWREFSVENEDHESGSIQYGGAPLAILEVLRDKVEKATGHRLRMVHSWDDSDDDIWISVPRPKSSPHAEDRNSALELNLDAWLHATDDGDATRPLLAMERDALRVGPITLPRRRDLTEDERALVPLAAHFDHYCLDTTTAASLVHVAESVLLQEPCLLEGETSVSKTSVVLYLAMLLGQPVVRLNLNGQTDTGELVGRFVPRDEAPKEGESPHPWRWQDGLVVTAMKRGWWVVLDELNLAEPQILERLNPALERIASLVLTEHRGEVIGAGGTPVVPTFRMFATMNPAEYAGRSSLSPAYRDRWRGYRYVRAPGEIEYLAMLRFLIYGMHPEVQVLGERFSGAAVDPPLASLAGVAGLDDFLRALARFHAGLEGAARSRTSSLGAHRKDRYIFTRRGLLAVMDYLAVRGGEEAEVSTLRKALVRYYLARVRPGSDRVTVAQLLDAAGIGPGLWAPERMDAPDASVSGHTDTNTDDAPDAGHGEDSET